MTRYVAIWKIRCKLLSIPASDMEKLYRFKTAMESSVFFLSVFEICPFLDSLKRYFKVGIRVTARTKEIHQIQNSKYEKKVIRTKAFSCWKSFIVEFFSSLQLENEQVEDFYNS